MKILLSTYPNKPRELKKFIMMLVWSKLAKCVSVVNYMKSYYFWEWKIQKSQEKLLIIKTSDSNIEKLKKMIEKNHPYDIPEIIILEPKEVNKSYLSRLDNN